MFWQIFVKCPILGALLIFNHFSYVPLKFRQDTSLNYPYNNFEWWFLWSKKWENWPKLKNFVKIVLITLVDNWPGYAMNQIWSPEEFHKKHIMRRLCRWRWLRQSWHIVAQPLIIEILRSHHWHGDYSH